MLITGHCTNVQTIRERTFACITTVDKRRYLVFIDDAAVADLSGFSADVVYAEVDQGFGDSTPEGVCGMCLKGSMFRVIKSPRSYGRGHHEPDAYTYKYPGQPTSANWYTSEVEAISAALTWFAVWGCQ